MKRAFLIVALFTVITFSVSAQASFRLGIKGGLNFANVDASSVTQTYDSRTGYHVGAFATIKLTKFAIQPEFIYSVQGSEFGDPTNLLGLPAAAANIKQSFSYLNIPILLKLYLVAGLNLQIGPQFGFLTKAKSENDIMEQIVGATDLKDAYKGSDVSLALGAGWDLPFGLTVDARYNLGLSKINDNAGIPESKNQVFQVSLGYRLIQIGK